MSDWLAVLIIPDKWSSTVLVFFPIFLQCLYTRQTGAVPDLSPVSLNSNTTNTQKFAEKCVISPGWLYLYKGSYLDLKFQTLALL